MKVIDIENWKRKNPYKNFINYSYPAFSISTRLDVTPLVDYCKQNKKSFFTTFLYIVSKSLNQVEDLRIRIYNDQVVMFDKVNPGYIVMNDQDVIVTSTTKFTDNFNDFYNQNRKDIEIAEKRKDIDKFDSVGDKNDCFYVSCLPWLDVTAVINPYDFKDKAQSSIPRVLWGKYVKENDRYKMGFDISAHHGLTDGKPLCDFVNKISEYIENISDTLK